MGKIRVQPAITENNIAGIINVNQTAITEDNITVVIVGILIITTIVLQPFFTVFQTTGEPGMYNTTTTFFDNSICSHFF